MNITKQQQNLLRMLPGVDIILENAQKDPFLVNAPRQVLTDCIRDVIEQIRISVINPVIKKDISGCNDNQKACNGSQKACNDEQKDCNDKQKNQLSVNTILQKVTKKVQGILSHNLVPVINGTGVVVHTNLGRSLLPVNATENLCKTASKYSNLEYNLLNGKRGLRYHAVEDIICKITGAKAAMVVNNNAGAVLLCLDTIANCKEVIVSRGELVEIGGSFRIPDVMAKSGGVLKEVGTTNRTHLKDYKNAISDKTGLLLKVHTSNFSVVGFTASVTLNELVELGKDAQIPVMEDLGSGTLVDFSQYGLTKEPTVMESVASGADIITFSGDKLLGGPQSGIILGSFEMIDKIRNNPLTRALRIDKLTLSALETILLLYLDEKKAVNTIPTLQMLTVSIEQLQKKAMHLYKMLENIDNNKLEVEILNRSSKAGGGSLPLLELPSRCIGIKIEGVSPNFIEKQMRNSEPPIIGRIEDNIYLMDLRTIQEDEFSYIENALKNIYG